MAEGTRHRRAFDAYWQLGQTRTLARLVPLLAASGRPVSLRTLQEWSARYHWQQRLAELERTARAEEERARVTAVREMADRQAREGILLQQKGTEWLTLLGVEQLTADAAIRAIVEGARLERLVRGEATERVDHESARDIRLEVLSDEQLARLIELAEHPLGGAGASAARRSVRLGDDAPDRERETTATPPGPG